LYAVAAIAAKRVPNGYLRLGDWTALWAPDGSGHSHLTLSYRGEYSPFETLDASIALGKAGVSVLKEDIGGKHPSLHLEIRAGDPAEPAQPEIRHLRPIRRQVRRLNPEAWAN
jgi:hypothetical protein